VQDILELWHDFGFLVK